MSLFDEDDARGCALIALGIAASLGFLAAATWVVVSVLQSMGAIG